MVFVYMGMVVFTGKFAQFNIGFSLMALLLCLVGRFFNIFPLSYLANTCRSGSEKIPIKMQCVLWFAGLRGAIAFALAANMPGNHNDVYATATLFICIFTTVVCGGVTEKILTAFGMKNSRGSGHDDEDHSDSDGDSEPQVKPRKKSETSSKQNVKFYELKDGYNGPGKKRREQKLSLEARLENEDGEEATARKKVGGGHEMTFTAKKKSKKQLQEEFRQKQHRAERQALQRSTGKLRNKRKGFS